MCVCMSVCVRECVCACACMRMCICACACVQSWHTYVLKWLSLGLLSCCVGLRLSAALTTVYRLHSQFTSTLPLPCSSRAL